MNFQHQNCESSSSFSLSFFSPVPVENYNKFFKHDEVYDDLSEEHCAFSVSHQSTLDGLYAWEKKLHQEVKV
ncbi:hypothetical protein P8452_63513 [Trifolium repens]|nr:hypothetical protein P8452_63513 [Trifolium repens]